MSSLRRAALCVALACAMPLGAAPVYVAIPLGSIGHVGSGGYAINDLGVVGGWYYLDVDHEDYRAFVHDGVFRPLDFPSGLRSFATGINNEGTIAGTTLTTSREMRGFVYRNGQATDIGTLGGAGAEAISINSNGWITGRADLTKPGRSHAFVLRDGTMHDIDGSNTNSTGYAINESGMVTGGKGEFTTIGNGIPRHAFLYSGGTTKDLGTLGGNFSEGIALNAHGYVVGWSDREDVNLPSRAFLHDGTTMSPIGPAAALHSEGRGINDRGEAVGTYNLTENDVLWRSFYHADGVSHDLDGLMNPAMAGVQLHEVAGINSRGQIAGVACHTSRACFAVRLDQVSIAGNEASSVRATAVEYHHAAFDHYFLAIDPDEIAALDHGTFSGWVRTGESFDVYREPVVGAAPMCRFFSAAFAPKSSHFFTGALAECLGILANANWQFEGVKMFALAPDVAGACPAGSSPVYRLYNDGLGDAPAHRFTTRLETQADMLDRGWVREGVGPAGVGFCTATLTG